MLAFSLRIKSDSGFYFGGVSPTETYINKRLFWLGLGFIALGSIMQFMQW